MCEYAACIVLQNENSKNMRDVENISLRCNVRHWQNTHIVIFILGFNLRPQPFYISFIVHKSEHRKNIHAENFHYFLRFKSRNMRGAYIFYNQIFILLNIILLVKMFTMCLYKKIVRHITDHDSSENFTLRFGNVES